MKTFTPFFSLFLFLSTVLGAQTSYTLNGTGDWNDAAMWTPNGVPGPGDTAIVTAGTIKLTDTVNISALYMSGGTITGDSNLTVTDSLAWSGGYITFSTTSLEVKPKITLTASAKTSIMGYAKAGRNFVNEGEIYWGDGGLVIGYQNKNIYFYNYGTLYDTGTSSITGGQSSQNRLFINHGKYIRSGTGETTINIVQFINFGEVTVNAGKLILPAGYITEENGSYRVDKGAHLRVGGPRTFAGPVHCDGLLSFTGQYTFHIKDTFDIKGEFKPEGWSWVIFDAGSTPLLDSCMVTIGNNVVFSTGKKVVIDSLRILSSGAGVTTYDSLIIRKYADFNNRAWIGDGTGSINFDKDANINVSGNITFLGQINNYGNIFWNSGDITLYYKNDGNFTMINNYGLFIDKTGVPSSVKMPTGNGTVVRHFNNYGTYFKKVLSSTLFSNGISFINKETGVLKGIGTITFEGPVENSGIVSPGDSVGTLHLTADYPSDSTTVLNIDLDGADRDEYDLLDIDGAATLKGTLNINLLHNYIPDEGEIFEIMKAGSLTDTFDVVNGKEISNCRYFAVQYSDTSVNLQVYGIEPPQANPDTINFKQDRSVEINVLVNDTDPDGDTLTVLFVGNPSHGTAVVSGDSTITYTPEAGFVGLDTMIYVIQKRSGCIDSSIAIVDVLSTVGIEELPCDSLNSFKIEQNYPNPFSISTTFSFSIPKEAFVKLSIYSIHGKLMKVLVSNKLPVGFYSYEWKTPGLTEGIYIYKFSAGEYNQTGKMFKMK